LLLLGYAALWGVHLAHARMFVDLVGVIKGSYEM
jgi:hypothetical protein